MSSEKHKRNIDKYNGSIDELVNDIGNLHYETLSELFLKLSKKLATDSEKDTNAGRSKLGLALSKASTRLEFVVEQIHEAWKISKPYM